MDSNRIHVFKKTTPSFNEMMELVRIKQNGETIMEENTDRMKKLHSDKQGIGCGVYDGECPDDFNDEVTGVLHQTRVILWDESDDEANFLFSHYPEYVPGLNFMYPKHSPRTFCTIGDNLDSILFFLQEVAKIKSERIMIKKNCDFKEAFIPYPKKEDKKNEITAFESLVY